MALTLISVPAGTSVQLDDGSHASVYIQNVGQRHVVIEPGAALLRAAQGGTFPVTYGTALTALAGQYDATLAYQVGPAATPIAAPGGLLVDGGSA